MKRSKLVSTKDRSMREEEQTSATTHPVQNNYKGSNRLPIAVTMRVYEVYEYIHGSQPDMIDDKDKGCRGGFDVLSEIIPFLYAYTFPKEQWEEKASEIQLGSSLKLIR